mgnify:CR=1 FL=1
MKRAITAICLAMVMLLAGCVSKDSEPSKLSLIEVKNIIKENKPAKSKKKTK